MSAVIELADVAVTCDGAPLQIEGRLSDGRWFYFRARHSSITLGVGSTPDDAVGNVVAWMTVGGVGEHSASWLPESAGRELLAWMLAAWVRELEIQAEARG